jgi:hypothetical protein
VSLTVQIVNTWKLVVGFGEVLLRIPLEVLQVFRTGQIHRYGTWSRVIGRVQPSSQLRESVSIAELWRYFRDRLADE